MLKIVKITDQMKERYDSFIKSMPNGSFRQGFSWGEVMAYDNDIFRLAVEQDRAIVATISIQKRRIPGTNYSFFYAPRGPIIDFEDNTPFILLINEIKKIAKKNKAIFLRVDPDVMDDDHCVKKCLTDQGFRNLKNKDWSSLNYPRILMRVDLKPDEKTILKNMGKSHRQYINSFENKGALIVEVKDIDGLKIFHEMVKDLGKSKGFMVRDIEYYKRLYDYFGDDRKLLLAKHGEKYLSGVLSLIYGNKCWYIHGASSIYARGNIHPNEALHWEVINWAKSRGAIFYDLAGTGTDYPPKEDNPNYNLYLFKKRFGAKITYLTGYYDYVFSQHNYKIFRFLEEKALPVGINLLNILKRHNSIKSRR